MPTELGHFSIDNSQPLRHKENWAAKAEVQKDVTYTINGTEYVVNQESTDFEDLLDDDDDIVLDDDDYDDEELDEIVGHNEESASKEDDKESEDKKPYAAGGSIPSAKYTMEFKFDSSKWDALKHTFFSKTPSPLDGLMNVSQPNLPGTLYPKFSLPQPLPYAKETEYLKKTPPVAGVTFVASELANPKNTYAKIAGGIGNGYNSHELKVFVETYTQFHFGSPHGGPKPWQHSKVVRADFFSGEEGHGRCGSMYLMQGHKEPVRCELPEGHGMGSNYHAGLLDGSHWYSWSESSLGLMTPVYKCGGVGYVYRNGSPVEVTCGLDMGHTGHHLSNLTTSSHQYRYEPFTPSTLQQVKDTMKIDFNEVTQSKITTAASANMISAQKPNSTMKMGKPVNVVVPVDEGQNLVLGTAMVAIEHNHESYEVPDPNGIVMHYKTETQATVKLTEATGALYEFIKGQAYNANPWSTTPTPGAGHQPAAETPATPNASDTAAPAGAPEMFTAKKPKKKIKKPDIDPKLDYTPTVTDFAKKESNQQKDELVKQAQGIMNSADRMPLGAFLFAQKVLAHFKDS